MDWVPKLDDEEETGAAPAYERQHLEEGTHELQIVQVIQHDNRLEVRLAHDDKRYGWVFCNMFQEGTQGDILLGQLVRSLGMTAAQYAATDPGDLPGRRLRAEIRHRTGKDGRLWVNVSKFLPTIQYAGQPAQAQPKPAAPARKTPAQQVKEASPAVAQHDDDIPF